MERTWAVNLAWMWEMAWIESHQALERHPKTLSLTAAMGWDLDTTIGKLHRFWWWCVDYAEDGDLRKHNDSIIGAAVGLNGDEASKFVKAMKAACWLDSAPYFRVHDWWFYIGRFLRVKYKTSHPEKWKAVMTAYTGREPDETDIPNIDCSKGGSKNGSKTRNQPTNQPTNLPARAGGRGSGGGRGSSKQEYERLIGRGKDRHDA